MHSNMPITVFSLYPKTPKSAFDMDCYVKKHLPMVLEAWKPYGLLDVKLIGLRAGIDSSRPSFNTIAIMSVCGAGSLAIGMVARQYPPCFRHIALVATRVG
jgi:hypothetical protein